MKPVWIVDDDKSIRWVLEKTLAREQIPFKSFPSASEALSQLDLGAEPPQVLVSDIRMPEMRGDEFLAYLKLNELFKQIPVVMLSSEDSTSERIRLLEEGAEDYIVKPFNPQELKIGIKKILD